MDIPFQNLQKQPPINLNADAYGLAALELSRLAALTTRCELDVGYGKDSWQRLDVYLPSDATLKGLPVFLYFHGGGHTHGYKEWMGLNAPPITAFPAIFISVDYHLAPVGSETMEFVPGQVDDGLTALAWAYKNVARYGGDPNRLHIGGHSAGARVSALVAIRHDLHAKYGLPKDAVKSCFPVSGSYDSRGFQVYGETPTAAKSVVTDPKLIKEVSPILHVSGNRVPFVLSWAEADNTMAKAVGPAFALALRQAGARAETLMFPTFDHFWIHIDQQRETNLWTRTLRTWMTGDPKTAPMPKAE
ncbi:MAG: hypothetical protein JWM77_3727 [Rhodospirillales bacterium]|nr:hypothetical protein [Rhodospirillales bacterium]